jgi:hypothetical protein
MRSELLVLEFVKKVEVRSTDHELGNKTLQKYSQENSVFWLVIAAKSLIPPHSFTELLW